MVYSKTENALAPGTCPLGQARPRHRPFAPAYFTTDWNSGDVNRLANWLSVDEYSTVSSPPVELIAVASSAVFSSGVPCAFRSICTPFSSVEQVAAVIVSDIFTPIWNFTPLEKSMEDRKSTRLNSSHLGISYAVFWLKIHGMGAGLGADPRQDITPGGVRVSLSRC